MPIAAGTSVIIQETSFGGITTETFIAFRPVEVGLAVDDGVETKYVLTSADADCKLPYAV